MNPMVWLLAGGVLGWLANIELGSDRRSGLGLNVVAGAIGASLAGLLLVPLQPDAVASSELSVGALMVALLGAILLLAVVNLFRLKGAP